MQTDLMIYKEQMENNLSGKRTAGYATVDLTGESRP